MRARIRALIAIVAVLGLVTPAPAAAQAPPAASVTRHAAVHDAAGRHPLALARRSRRARAREQRGHRRRALQPRVERPGRPRRRGLLRPVPVRDAHQELDRHQGHQPLLRRRDRQHQDRPVELRACSRRSRRAPACSVGFNNNKRDTNNAFSTFNPVYNSSLSFNLTQPLLKNFGIDRPRLNLKLAKKSREITDVQFRQTVINTVAARQGLLLRAAVRDRQPGGRAEEPAARQEAARRERDPRQGRHDGAARRGHRAVGGGEPRGRRDRGRERARRGRGQPEARDLPAERPADVAARASHRRIGRAPSRCRSTSRPPSGTRSRTGPTWSSARKNLERSDYNLGVSRTTSSGPSSICIANYGGSGADGTQIRDAEGNPLPAPIPGGYGDAVSRGVRLRLPDLDASASTCRTRSRTAAPRRTRRRPSSSKDQALAVLPAPGAAGRRRGAYGRRAVSSRASSAWPRARPHAASRPSGSTPRRRSSPRACPRTSSSRRRSATWPRPR